MTVPLPPLPPVPEEGYRPGGRSIVDIVEREHRQLRDLSYRMTDPGIAPERLREAVEVLTAALSRHLSAEEQYLFPTARAALPDRSGQVDREIAADADLLTALRALTGPADPALAAVADRVRRHVDAVAPLLAALREVATEAELIRLGNRWEIAEEAAPTRPHPGAPGTPPWNRVVEPALGVVDKVRDAVTGRPTYLSDLDQPPA
ncbi:hemerythrin domain-containing protein [Micromonospora sp. NPDC048830]|uniref:hemerythrin domain-containing protein n=1 Tax=Micromonospora sp. NPDC048830 TaxID=3364257 RepID=UPI003718CD90